MKILLALLSFWMSFCVTPKKIVAFLEGQQHSEKNNLEFVTDEAVRVACVQMRVRGYKNLKGYLSELTELARSAADAGAQLIVYPEYVGLLSGTLLPMFDRLLYWTMEGRTPEGLDQVELDQHRVHVLAESFQNYIYETYMYTFGTIARLNHIYIAAGSCVFYEEGRLCNRCVVFGPDGTPVGAQDKTAALNFDRAIGITPSDKIEIFDLPFGKTAVILGSDAFYFEAFKIAAEQGAKIIAVPDSRGGVTRDLLRCRVNESGVYALYSGYTKTKVQETRAAILAPMALTAERTGIAVSAQNGRTSVVTSRLNLQRLERVLYESEPNPEFLAKDYLHSYTYCGRFIPTDETEPAPTGKEIAAALQSQ